MACDAENLLTHLSTLGCALMVEGEVLHVSPRRHLTPDLRERIRTHKTALMALLMAPAVDSDPGPWGYHSQELNADIWLCMTPEAVAVLRSEGAVGYLPTEIRILQEMKRRDPEGFSSKLRSMHAAKEVLGVEIAVTENP